MDRGSHLVLLFGVLAAVLQHCGAIPVESTLREEAAGAHANVQLQATSKQYEADTDHLKTEFDLLRHLTSSTVDHVIELFQEQDKKYDSDYHDTHAPMHSMPSRNCSAAPACEELNRKHCFATENTCGPCIKGFEGVAGDSNQACTPTNCARAPDCTELNREACGDFGANTCGPCMPDYHVPDTMWNPELPEREPGNDICMAVEFRPVVFVHGLGDTFRGLASSIPANVARRAFHVIKTFAAEPGGALFSIAKPFSEMVDDFAREVRSIPGLKNGFNVVGISQGGLIARAFVEKFNDPPVYNFVSLHAPQSGIALCPGRGGLDTLPCEYAVHLGLVAPHDYWRGVDATNQHSKESYLSWHNYLQDINNEGPVKNSTYRANMLSLNRYVLVKAEKDRVVRPAESEWHGYFQWGNMSHVLSMEETDEYKEDVIGLRTLNDLGRLVRIKTPGGHIQTPPEFFEKHILQYFDNGWYQDGAPFDLSWAFEPPEDAHLHHG